MYKALRGLKLEHGSDPDLSGSLGRYAELFLGFFFYLKPHVPQGLVELCNWLFVKLACLS